jgi:hypothetical protein
MVSLGHGDTSVNAAMPGQLTASANPPARVDALPEDQFALNLFEQESTLLVNGQGAWSTGRDAAVGGVPTPERIDTRDDLLIAGEGDDMQIGSHGKEVLIGGFAAARQQDAGDIASDNDLDGADTHAEAIEAFLSDFDSPGGFTM